MIIYAFLSPKWIRCKLYRSWTQKNSKDVRTHKTNLNTTTSTRIVSFCLHYHHEWHHCVVETDMLHQWTQRLSFLLSNPKLLYLIKRNRIIIIILQHYALCYTIFVWTYMDVSSCITHLHNVIGWVVLLSFEQHHNWWIILFGTLSKDTTTALIRNVQIRMYTKGLPSMLQ